MSLLAIDLGLRAGFAWYDDSGKLVRYRSQCFGAASRMRRSVHGELSAIPCLTHVIAEGDRGLSLPWEKWCTKRGIAFKLIQAYRWRKDLLYARQQRSGFDAKRAAEGLAREVIEQCGARKPTSLRHDAAEAILIGWWGVQYWVKGR